MCSPMPGMLKGLDKLMNESMNTKTDRIKKEWEDIEEWPQEARWMSAQADQKQGEHSLKRLDSGSERAQQRSAQRPLGRSRNPV